MKIRNILVLLFTLVLLSCTAKKNLVSVKIEQTVVNSKWQVIEIEGKSIDARINEVVPTLFFNADKGNYSILTGCNTLNGEFTIAKSNSIKFVNGISTMMYCENMSVEDGFRNILTKIDSYSLDADILFLKNGNKVLATLKRLDSANAVSLRNTSWTLDLLAIPGVDFNTLFKDVKPTLIFDEEQSINGNAACNNYRTTYNLEGNFITFGPIASTKMMCPNIKAEDVYLDTLKKINKISFSNSVLTFMIDDVAVMRFKRN